jgi:methionyl-tRNA formyltransferase
MARLKAIVLANWGLGAAMLRAVAAHPGVEVELVAGRRPSGDDPWAGAVPRAAAELGLAFVGQEGLDLDALAARLARADLLVVHAYPRRLPAGICAAPRLAGVNLHPSLLPRHRGPAPTDWVLRNREPVTGLTLHRLAPELDAGEIIHQVEVPVGPGHGRAEIIESMKRAAPGLMAEGLARLMRPGFAPRPQDESLATYAPRL